MILNSRSSNFMFLFPKKFFSDSISSKYMPYLKRHPIAYDTLDNFMSSTIQSVTFPTLSMQPVSQTRAKGLGKQQEYKNSTAISDLFTRDITVTFKSLEGYINYFIFMETMLEYLDFQNKELYLDDLSIRFMDQGGYITTTTKFTGVYFKSLSEINLSYSDTQPEFRTFSCNFSFFEMKFIIEHD